jgi:hypothetical protein
VHLEDVLREIYTNSGNIHFGCLHFSVERQTQSPLAVLAGRMPWAQIESALAPAVARRNRRGEVVCDSDLFGTTLEIAGAGVSARGGRLGCRCGLKFWTRNPCAGAPRAYPYPRVPGGAGEICGADY